MKRKKGAITLEASLVVPMVVMLVYFLMCLMNITWVYDSVQTSINNTANTISSNAYVISQSGLSDIVTESGTNDKTVGAHVMEAINSIISGDFTKTNFDELMKNLTSVTAYQNSLNGLRSDEGSYFKNYAINIGNIFLSLAFHGDIDETTLNGLIGDTSAVIAEESLMNDVGGGYVSKDKINKRMKDIGIVDGVEGMKVKANFKVGGDTPYLEIIADYKLDLGNPFFKMKPFNITQRTVVRLWIGKKS